MEVIPFATLSRVQFNSVLLCILQRTDVCVFLVGFCAAISDGVSTIFAAVLSIPLKFYTIATSPFYTSSSQNFESYASVPYSTIPTYSYNESYMAIGFWSQPIHTCTGSRGFNVWCLFHLYFALAEHDGLGQQNSIID